MGVKEVGAYIQGLRKQRGLTQQALAAKAGVGQNYIWRVETGDIKRPSNHHMTALMRALQGNMEEVSRLMAQNGHDEEQIDDEAVAHIETLPPNERERMRQEALELIDEFLSHPRKLDKWLSYGEGLRDKG